MQQQQHFSVETYKVQQQVNSAVVLLFVPS